MGNDPNQGLPSIGGYWHDPGTGLLEKLCCEDSLIEFAESSWNEVVDEPFQRLPHVELLCTHLEAVSRHPKNSPRRDQVGGSIADLLVNIPPSVGKSTILSVIWPAWVWTWWPAARFLFFSYADKVIKRDSRACRKLIRSEWYQANWGQQTQTGTADEIANFDNVAGGWRMAMLVGAGTAFHPDFKAIDDPQGQEGSKNPNERQRVVDWFTGTLPTRGKTRGAATVVQQQRLDEDDLSGYVLQFVQRYKDSPIGKRWHHIMLPMHFDPTYQMEDRGYGGDWRSEEGELLAPSLQDEDAVAELTAVMDGKDATNSTAQLEQKPKRASGDMFKVGRITMLARESVPELEEVVRFWDRAATAGGGCFTAGVLLGKRDKDVFVLHVAKGQWAVDDVYSQMSACAITDEANYTLEKTRIGVEQEPGSGGKEAAQNAQRNLMGHRVEVHSPSTNKEARAQPFALAMAFGNVYCVDKEDWTAAFIEELRKFPGGAYKDQTDATSGAYQMLFGSKQKKKRSIIAGLNPETCATDGCERPVKRDEKYCCDKCEGADAFGDPAMVAECKHTSTCDARDQRQKLGIA